MGECVDLNDEETGCVTLGNPHEIEKFWARKY
jgi:hypothetical protein